MKVLITGVTGFVGSHLADYILENTDWEIDGIIRWRSPLDNVEHILKRINFLYADLCDDVSLRRAVEKSKPDYVFHLAAQSFPRTSFDSPLDTFDTNIQGTLRLLEAIKTYAQEAWVHVCSSSEVYGRAKFVPINEHHPFHPASPYAISKVGTDLVAQHYAEAYGMKILITRMFTHTGPRRGDVFVESSFAKQIAMIEAGLMEPVVHVGNLESLRTFADVRDAVRAYFMLLTVNPRAGEVYNIGGNHTCTVGEMLDYLLSLSDRNIQYSRDPARIRPIDADKQVPDCTKFKTHTGWEPTIKFKKTMQDLLEYWRKSVKIRAFLTR